MTLVLENVKKKYKTFELDLSMTLESGTITGLIGRNGAGESTTFKAILGLIKLTEGKVLIDGKQSQNLKPADKENIGVVLSDSGFSGYMTVKDVIATMSAMYKKFDKADFTSKCEYFNIPLNQKIKEFSTGMKAKLKVLLAMSHGAKLLILDEPTSGLDVVVRNEILDLLREYMEKDEENSILISSHISSDLEGLCDDVYFIENGKIILHEETDTLMDAYGILKVTPEQYQKLEQEYILCTKKDKYGYTCLTNQKQYFIENYPDIVIEKSEIDEIITLMLSDRKEGK
ncbi:MAG: ABC transporter ATP-binding protein [Lachnospiraceae bacterium]|nr:ABC transporter ATP-binding protein [Lachnospiraceae bacterium]